METKQVFEQSDVNKNSDITGCLVRSALAAGLGSSLIYGYNLSVMTGLSNFIRTFYNESYYSKTNEYLSENHLRWLWATTIAVFCVGGSVGSLVAIYFMNFFGRRGTLLVNILVTTLASLLMFLSMYMNSYETLIIGRLVIGISSGIVIVTVPLYLSEISPVGCRGGISAIHQFGVSSGILIGQCVSLLVFYSEHTWQFAFLFNLVICLAGGVVLYLCPESPRWLLLGRLNLMLRQSDESELLLSDNRQNAATRNALVQLRKNINVEDEIIEMLNERAELESSNDRDVSVLDLIFLKNRIWKWPLTISLVLITVQQLCGINGVMYYTTEIFWQAGLNEYAVRLATIGTGLISVASAFGTILNVDRLGRRVFLIVSYSIMALATVFLSVSINSPDGVWPYISILFVFIYILGFSPGPGAMTFVLIPELWTQGPRPAAMSFAGQFNWWSNFTVGLAFPFMLNEMGGYTFLIFTFVICCTVAFTYIFLPETKNKTFTEIVTSFQQNRFTSM